MMSVTDFLFAILSLTTIIDCAPFDANICYANYLKSKNLVSAKYGNSDVVGGYCMSFIHASEISFLISLKNQFEKKKGLNDSLECIIESMREEKLSDYIFKLQVVDQNNSAVSEDEKKMELEEAKQKLAEIMGNAVFDCHFSNQYSSIFDSLISGSSKEEEISDEEDYCVRKHIIDNNLIDTAKYNLNENPKSLDKSSIECEKIYKVLVDQIKDQLTEGMKNMKLNENAPFDDECALSAIESGEYINKLEYFDYLREFGLEQEQLEEEKKKFIQIIKDLALGVIKNCYNEAKYT